ncbi:MAG: FHA domain-containing protein [Deltaproteobacteria bacterium]|nr:FHA domain-containing protein [Deltaproteobacteria bacterium]
MKLTLKVFEGEKQLFTRVLSGGLYKLGRSESCDIVLNAENVSRQHLEIKVSENSAYLSNLSRTKKTMVNGKPCEACELANGDQLVIGAVRILIFHGEREASAPAPVFDVEPNGEEFRPLASDRAADDAKEPGGEAAPKSNGEPQSPVEKELGKELEKEIEPQPHAAEIPFAPMVEPGGPSVQGSVALNLTQTQVELKPLIAKLIFTEGPRKGDEIKLEAYEVTLGRSKKADVYLDDEKLSRVHAKITRMGMGYRLIDLNSRNGTYVNGLRILEHPLSSFDVIEIGRCKIKFLIHDIVIDDGLRAGGKGVGLIDNTQSLQLDPADQARVLELVREPKPVKPSEAYSPTLSTKSTPGLSVLGKILIAVLVIGMALYFILPSGEKKKPKVILGDKDAKTVTTVKDKPGEVPIPVLFPKEYYELSQESQRQIEGLYTQALEAASRGRYEEAVLDLKKIHEHVPFYKGSKELFEEYSKKLKEQQFLQAQEKAKGDQKQDLVTYLDEGKDYLKEGDFERAAESFMFALNMDPTNEVAKKGLRAAEYKVKDINDLPPEKDPEEEKKQAIRELFRQAVTAYDNKNYQEAINKAEKIRQVELKGDTSYLNMAKQIIDQAKIRQKEDFEPYLIAAREKYAESDFNASRDLCEEMVKKDPSYEEANECLIKAKRQLNRLAKEAYTRGYILESMNKIEEAVQYWNRAKNYVRPGDEYYNKVMKKLDTYQ